MTVSIHQKRCQEGGKLLDGQSRREKMNGLGYQLLCGVCAFAFAQPALAQDSGPDQAAAESSASGSVSTSDIVVTALRRSERLPAVPVSVTAKIGRVSGRDRACQYV